MSDELETRSTDGSDSEGSLCDFIAHDDNSEAEEESVVSGEEEENEGAALQKEFPFDRNLLEERSSDGPRRSRRTRKPVTKYVDEHYAKLMFDDVETDNLESSEEDFEQEDDEVFAVEENSSDDEESDDEENQEEEEDNMEQEEAPKQKASQETQSQQVKRKPSVVSAKNAKLLPLPPQMKRQKTTKV